MAALVERIKDDPTHAAVLDLILDETIGICRHVRQLGLELVAAVMKVEVEVGQKVTADDAVVILESMKMESPVLADVAGSVLEIVVSEGDVVNDGDPLVVIKVL